MVRRKAKDIEVGVVQVTSLKQRMSSDLVEGSNRIAQCQLIEPVNYLSNDQNNRKKQSRKPLAAFASCVLLAGEITEIEHRSPLFTAPVETNPSKEL